MEKQNLSELLKKLEDISDWFDGQEEADIEQGLQKVKEGVALIKVSKERLKIVENEFNDIQKSLEDGESDE